MQGKNDVKLTFSDLKMPMVASARSRFALAVSIPCACAQAGELTLRGRESSLPVGLRKGVWEVASKGIRLSERVERGVEEGGEKGDYT